MIILNALNDGMGLDTLNNATAKQNSVHGLAAYKPSKTKQYHTSKTFPSGEAPNPRTETSKPVFPRGRLGIFTVNWVDTLLAAISVLIFFTGIITEIPSTNWKDNADTHNQNTMAPL